MQPVVITLFFLFFLCSQLAGCVVAEPNDVRFESVDVIRYREVPLTFPDMKDKVSRGLDEMKLLRIHISSATDLSVFGKTWGLNVSRRAHLCEEEKRELFASNYLSADALPFHPALSEKGKNLVSLRKPNGRITYQLYVPLKGDESTRIVAIRSSGSERELLYDVDAFLEDMCVGFAGGGMQGLAFTSSLARVPRQNIVDAVKARSRSAH